MHCTSIEVKYGGKWSKLGIKVLSIIKLTSETEDDGNRTHYANKYWGWELCSDLAK